MSSGEEDNFVAKYNNLKMEYKINQDLREKYSKLTV